VTKVRSTSVQVEGLSYQLAPRAAVFRRDEGDASDVATLQRLMRSNDWAADSVSLCTSLTSNLLAIFAPNLATCTCLKTVSLSEAPASDHTVLLCGLPGQ
jgi:Phospholipase B